MPPRIPNVTIAIRTTSREQYVCTSCLLKAASRQIRPKSTTTRRFSQPRPCSTLQASLTPRRSELKRSAYDRRNASNGSLASSTAINAPSSVPRPYGDLYQALLALQETARSYVDLSRLQLAARSLESETPIIRVAFLGLGNNGELAARRLARALLSDPLSDEEEWEQRVLQPAPDKSATLLKYGNPEDDVSSSAPLLHTLHIPSPYLQRNNVEILITTLNANTSSTLGGSGTVLEEAILVPSLTAPNSSAGHRTSVRHPVHKAVIVAEGVTGAVEYGRFPEALAASPLIEAALNVSLGPRQDGLKVQEASGNAVDIDLSTHALQLFRQSKSNGAQFSDEWQLSRISRLSDWVAGPPQTESTSALQPAVRDVVASVLASTSTSLTTTEAAESALATAATVPDLKRTELQTAISAWAAGAHGEIQNKLDRAFTYSTSWRRTAWWRLFWRIDDVTICASDVLQRNWLVEAESRLAYVSGCIAEAGLKSIQPQARREDLPLWPDTIFLGRKIMLDILVPELHAKAQRLLVTAYSTIGGTAALGAWFYAATAGHGIYESGAIVALGLVWALRRLQTRWGKERRSFASTTREDARRVVSEVERELRTMVNDNGRMSPRPEDVQSWQQARRAIQSCREALDKIEVGK